MTKKELILENMIMKCEKDEDNKMFVLDLKVALIEIRNCNK